MLSEDSMFGDVFSEYNMKPWFEKIRGYLIAALLAISLLLFYQTDYNNVIVCVPSVFIAQYPTTLSSIVNQYCEETASLPFYNIGVCLLIYNSLLLILSNWWLAVPHVSIISLLMTCKRLLKMMKIKKQLKNGWRIINAMENKKIKENVIKRWRETLIILTKMIKFTKMGQHYFSFTVLYIIRNFLVLAIIVIYFIMIGLFHFSCGTSQICFI